MKHIALIFMTFLVGCAWNQSLGPAFFHHEDVGKDESLLYIYSPVKNGYITGCTMVTIDDVDSLCFGNPGYGKVVLTPGRHSLKYRQKAAIDVGPKVDLVDYDFEPGKAYYFRYSVIGESEDKGNTLQSKSFSNEMFHVSGTLVWQEVNVDIALDELRGLTLWR